MTKILYWYELELKCSKGGNYLRYHFSLHSGPLTERQEIEGYGPILLYRYSIEVESDKMQSTVNPAHYGVVVPGTKTGALAIPKRVRSRPTPTSWQSRHQLI